MSLIDQAIAAHAPVSRVWALFSGGHDSLCATSLASTHPRFSGAVHIDTGIGIPETRTFVEETCRRNGWPLVVVSADDCGQVYEDLVREWGFPGPPHHGKMYNRLKERPLAKLFRDNVPMPTRAILVTGCRSQESRRRMGHVQPIQRQKRRVWVAVIHDWTADDVADHIARTPGLERNPVVDLIHKSGECLCGAFAKRWELDELTMWFPKTAERIRRLEDEVVLEKPWGWGERPSAAYRREKAGQARLFPWREMLCSSCHAR